MIAQPDLTGNRSATNGHLRSAPFQEATINIRATAKDDLQERLTDAVESLKDTALRGRSGILVTRHSPRTYTVAVTSDVPFGTTHELDLAGNGATTAAPTYVIPPPSPAIDSSPSVNRLASTDSTDVG